MALSPDPTSESGHLDCHVLRASQYLNPAMIDLQAAAPLPPRQVALTPLAYRPTDDTDPVDIIVIAVVRVYLTRLQLQWPQTTKTIYKTVKEQDN